MNIDRPLTQKEKALVLGVHQCTISAYTRAGGLNRFATATEVIRWRQENPHVTIRHAYPKAGDKERQSSTKA